MSDATAALRAHTPQHEFLIAIDSDGCVFDTMELKHKECFIPNIVKFWDLQPVSKYARMAAEFVNLYSVWRGVNRFPALVKTLDLLADWDRVQARGDVLPGIPNLRRWVETESKLGNPALEAYCRQSDEPDMVRALAWSRAVNETVNSIVKGGVPPFPKVRECLALAAERADCMVCSQTPSEALEREWQEQNLDAFVFCINGQEAGKKAEHIEMANAGRYQNERILMVGDAPGDLKAARANEALFFPVLPGEEERSWERLHAEALDRFFAGTYAGDYEAALIAEFESYLPETPPWKS